MGVVNVLLQILSPTFIRREATLGADEKQTFAWLLHVVQRQPVCSAVECARQWSSKVESRKYSPHIVHPHRIRPAVVFLKTVSIYSAWQVVAWPTRPCTPVDRSMCCVKGEWRGGQDKGKELDKGGGLAPPWPRPLRD
jgi:hypothetical protein